MSPRRQRVLWLRFGLQLAQKAVAERLGVNQQSVSRHERMARETLREVGQRLVYRPHPKRPATHPPKPRATDPMVAEHISEIERMERLVRKYKGIRRRATKPATVRRLNKTLVTLWRGAGQLRRTVAYMISRDRHVTAASHPDEVSPDDSAEK